MSSPPSAHEPSAIVIVRQRQVLSHELGHFLTLPHADEPICDEELDYGSDNLMIGGQPADDRVALTDHQCFLGLGADLDADSASTATSLLIGARCAFDTLPDPKPSL